MKPPIIKGLPREEYFREYKRLSKVTVVPRPRIKVDMDRVRAIRREKKQAAREAVERRSYAGLWRFDRKMERK